jgi:O-antigen ligase
MKFSAPYILLLLLLAYFPFMVMRSQEKNKVYISYILYLLPFMIFDLMPKALIVTVFDLLSYGYLFFFLSFNKPGKNSVYGLLAYGLVSLLLVGVFNSEFVIPSIMNLMRFLSIIIFAKVLLTELALDENYHHTIFRQLKIVLFVAIFFMTLQMIFGLKISVEANFISPYYMNPNIDSAEGIRYPSYFQDPQKYAQFIAAISFLFLIRDDKNPKALYINLALFLVAVVSMFYTGGRGALLGLTVGLFFIFLFFPMRYKVLFMVPVVIIGTIIFLYKQNFVVFNRESNTSGALEERAGFWIDALRIFEVHPFLGIGIGNYQLYTERHNPDNFWFSQGEITFFDQPESGYLKYLIEFGIFGFMLYMSFLIIPMVKAVWIFLTRSKNYQLVIICAALLSWMIGFITVCSLTDSRILIVITTLVCLLISITNRESSTQVAQL